MGTKTKHKDTKDQRQLERECIQSLETHCLISLAIPNILTIKQMQTNTEKQRGKPKITKIEEKEDITKGDYRLDIIYPRQMNNCFRFVFFSQT